jgi:hypothetical protein
LEIINALKLLQKWKDKLDKDENIKSIVCNGRTDYLIGGRELERTCQAVRIIKPEAAVKAYRQMLLYYGVKTLVEYDVDVSPGTDTSMTAPYSMAAPYSMVWENLGGQLVPADKVRNLTVEIKSGEIKSWGEVHEQYKIFQSEYPKEKTFNALQVLRYLITGDEKSNVILNEKTWNDFFDEALRIRAYIEEQVCKTKQKDYDDPYRMITYNSTPERDAVLGKPEENQFVLTAKEDSKKFAAAVTRARRKIMGS